MTLYNSRDLEEYWDRFFNSKVKINEAEKEKIYKVSGSHPFLLDLFNYHLLGHPLITKDISVAIDETKRQIGLTILNNYSTILKFLMEEHLDTKLLQMVVGPVYDITRTEAEKVDRYGLVKLSKKHIIQLDGKELLGYDGFSEDFTDYLNLVRVEIPVCAK